ncbi:MAG: YggS family pyridoxal phosphate-dependent enzyme [Clostridia bacterium]|nr:YggS family pyridoxal phosphate-dependent enzyme [Clostridia bacterium]
MIENNVKNLLKNLTLTNPFGERVTLVAAVKLQSPDDINAAIAAGITDIGDNHVQEFRDKFDEIRGEPKRHFIGRLQTNKVKYLVGKVDLYHSVDRLNLAQVLSEKSEKAEVISNVLLQVNIGNEESKGGFSLDETDAAYAIIRALPAIKITGLMAMLPDTDDKKLLYSLAEKMRQKYDYFRERDENFTHLSMGMSGDYELCISAGSNMIRLGTAIFGNRNYK